MSYYTKSGTYIRNPEAYANTGAPMYKSKYDNKNINKPTSIYKAELVHDKKYIGKTCDFDKRCDQHFTGNGSMVTKKFNPKYITEIDKVHGFFSDDIEQYYTEKYICKYGYQNVRGGQYTNSKTLCKNKETTSKVNKNIKFVLNNCNTCNLVFCECN